MVICGYGGGGCGDGVVIPETGNRGPRVLTDGEGELIFIVLWSYVEEMVGGRAYISGGPTPILTASDPAPATADPKQ